MKTLFLIAFGASLFVFIGCGENDNFKTVPVSGPEAIIPWQDCAYFSDNGFTVCFIGAKEERCPCNTNCLWEGSVDATLRVTSVTGIDTTITLTTNSNPVNLHNLHAVGGKTIVFVNTSGIDCADFGQYEKYKVIVRVE